MHLRQILTNPDFLNALAKANTEEARRNELKRLNTHAKNLTANINALLPAERIDIDFNPIRVFLDSQYVISCLNELVEKIKQSDALTDGEIAEMIHDLFNNRNEEAMKIRNDYFPGLPKDYDTDAHELLWNLAKLCGKHWDLDPIKILIPTLKITKLLNDTTICKDHRIILNEERTYPISITTFLNRLVRGEGLTYYDAIQKKNVELTKLEKVRLVYTLTQFANPNDLRVSPNGNQIVTDVLGKLRKECVELLKSDNDVHHAYYNLDKDHYYKIIGKPWIIKDPVKLFDFLGCLSPQDWPQFLDALFTQHNLADINRYILNKRSFNEAVQDQNYYNKNRNHNAAVLHFFVELYSRNRKVQPEFENGFLNMLTDWFFPQSWTEKIAYSKSNKHPGVVTLQAYFTSNEELSDEKMRGYFVSNGQEKWLNATCEPGSKLGAIAQQIKTLGVKNAKEAGVSKQGLFSASSAMTLEPQKANAELTENTMKEVKPAYKDVLMKNVG